MSTVAHEEYCSRLKDLEEQLIDAIYRKGQRYGSEYRAIDELSPPDGESGRAGMLSGIEAGVKNVLAPWYDIPDPSRLQANLNFARLASNALVGESIECVELGTKLTIETPIPVYMSRVSTNLDGWNGETVRAFQDNYARRFDPMFALQANGALVLFKSLEAYIEIWRTARSKILGIVEAAIDSVEALNDWGSEAQQKLAFDILMATVGVLGTLAVGPAGTIMAAVVGGTLTVLKDPVTSEAAVGGTTIPAVWEAMRSSIRDLKNEVVAAEATIGDLLNDTRHNYDQKLAIDIDGSGENLNMTGTEMISLPTPGSLVSGHLDTDSSGGVSTEELADGVEPPNQGYQPPNYSDSV